MSFEYGDVKENTARASTTYAPISFKHSVEICRFITGKNIKKAINYLEMVQNKKVAIPFKRYNRDMPHKRGTGPARYPVNACAHFTKLLNNAIKNAQDKGLNEDELTIKKATANRSMSRNWQKKYRRGRLTSIWVVVEEKETEKKKKGKK